MAWTKDRVELLKKRWYEGCSASDIATELGGVTRNAVLGKVHRMGLNAPPNETRHEPQKPQTPQPPRIVTKGEALPKIIRLVPKPEDHPIEPDIEPRKGVRCTLMQLTEDTCRWPMGDPSKDDFCYCGLKPLKGLPYCDGHARIAYEPASDRRKRKVHSP